jgi:PadR family transcriptional regulator AphA
MSRERGDRLLLGEWACLGILHPAPAHGFAVAARLKPGGDIGRVWSMSRALTYRALDQLVLRGFVEAVGEERGLAGGNRTLLAVTMSGRAQFRTWLATPTEHLRDMRSELLLKIVLADGCGVELGPMLLRQREHVSAIATALEVAAVDGDVVGMWRSESAHAALRFLDRMIGATVRGEVPR